MAMANGSMASAWKKANVAMHYYYYCQQVAKANEETLIEMILLTNENNPNSQQKW